MEHKRLLCRIARAYYCDGQTQQQIAERLGLSRVKISRLLDEARREKVVRITVASPNGSDTDLEGQLEETYGLKEAIVVPLAENGTDGLAAECARFVAEYLTRDIQSGKILALGWGRSVLSVISALEPMDLPNVRVVQLVGGLGELEAETHGADLVRRAAQILGAKPRPIHAPGIVESKTVRDALMRDPQIAETLKLASQANVALVGIGVFGPGSTLLSCLGNAMNAQEVEGLMARGAVGDVALQFFDEHGAQLNHPINNRILGIGSAQIKKIDHIIGVARGHEKVRAIRAALLGGLVNVLVTDDKTAHKLLSRHRQNP